MAEKHLSFAVDVAHRALVADGAMGTALLAYPRSSAGCLEERNLSAPEQVRCVHKAYLQAGAEMIQTNTFGANRCRLDEHGLAHLVEAINRAAVALARSEASDSVWVAGSVGPLNRPVGPSHGTGRLGAAAQSVSAAEAADVFREQIRILCDSGVDIILLETFGSLAEVSEALRAAKDVVGGRLPVLVQLTVNGAGALRSGPGLAAAIRVLESFHPEMMGFNCSEGPASIAKAVQAVKGHANQPISAQPSAGLPSDPVGERLPDFGSSRALHASTPEEFGSWAREMLAAGVRLLGGCCGTTPRHIRALREAVDGWRKQTTPVGFTSGRRD